MRKTLFLLTFFLVNIASFAQKYNSDSAKKVLEVQKDSTLRAMMHADSIKVDKEFSEKFKWEKLKGIAIYPLIKGSENSGVIPVKDPTEIPDPNIEYKLLFELVANNPDSLAKDINVGLAEVARIINLHIASGVPQKNLKPVIVVHAAALNAITTNDYYKEHFKVDNPNLAIINDLKKIGCDFIACGQAMTFFDVKREALLPLVKVSLTAQTVLSSYQLKGFVLYKI